MTWLLHNYFLPQLRPANSTAMARKEPSVRPLAPLLKEYKALLKATTRDVSLRRQHEPRLTAMLRDAERWVAEAKVAADVASGDALGWGGKGEDGGEGNGEEEDARERWALERLADALVERGALVPVAKKYVSTSINCCY